MRKILPLIGLWGFVTCALVGCEPDSPIGTPFAMLILPAPEKVDAVAFESRLRSGFKTVAGDLKLRFADASDTWRDIDKVKHRVRINAYGKDVAIGVEWGGSDGFHLITFYGDSNAAIPRRAYMRVLEMLKENAISYEIKQMQ